MIKFIPLDDVFDIRNIVLREGKLPPGQPRFPSDDVEGAFHLGYFAGDTLACVASFHPEAREPYQGVGYQLRGMATLEEYQGKNFGNQLLNFAIVYLRGQKANYIWCNARKKALRFYQNIGFEVISPEFEVPGIGPHYVMYLKIQ
ncbi:GNAT family N-acetyltransferase [Mucilaginibacter sp. PPCGB 2223]|uniref:GNAT family N-acetyltransferase n=1 Tax=Mucilaginibacter sp. PPCGB 2223 TaxID=1886027 RepID=UPI000826B3C8|nr:GNAT family N-acetyltransferase [Mucilaginibacter sp. PPCGB 2223]OCX51492.1 GNAT family N-acetyltransferase [Mucilaginibacter sp. PPCGB 2223]